MAHPALSLTLNTIFTNSGHSITIQIMTTELIEEIQVINN